MATEARRDVPSADALRAVPLFSELPEAVLARIAAQLSVQHVAGGDWLFREGAPGESAFVVMSGRLEVVSEASAENPLRSVGRGSVIGEIALLTGRPRAASIRARRDSQLLRIGREEFMNLLSSEPSVAITLTRQLGTQLAEHRRGVIDVPAPPATIAVLAADAAVDLDALASALADSLKSHGTLGYIDESLVPSGDGPTGDGVGLLDRFEREHERVLLVCPTSAGEGFRRFCIRQADRVLLVADAASPPPPSGHVPPGSDLALVVASGQRGRIERWVEAVDPRGMHRLDERSIRPGIDRCARRLAGRSVGVVLSGGGARGFAHIGVLEQLLAAGIEIDRIGGCSIGAYIGAQFAQGSTIEEIIARTQQEFVERKPLGDYTLPLVAFTRGRRGLAMLQRTFGDAVIEELPREFYCTACDLIGNTVVEHRRGSLVDAVGSSVAMPAFVPPVVDGARILVDGGVLNNLPVESMAGRSEGPVLAVDVTAPSKHPGSRNPRFPRSRLASRLHALLTGAEDAPLGLAEAIARSVVLGSADTEAAARQHAQLVVSPRLPDVEMLDYHRFPDALQAGRAAAAAALEHAPAGLLAT
jgi:predicted acylesterase/phospholipase RssA/CRP-like cAMP-binding protein